MNKVYHKFEHSQLGRAAFFRHVIIPWLVISVFAFIVASLGDGGRREFHRLVLVVFFSVYFLLIRAGLYFMSWQLHKELKRDFGDKYQEKLARLPDFGSQMFGMFGLKLGSTLARIKYILHQEREQNRQKQKSAFR